MQASSAKEAAIEDLLQRLEELNEKMGGIVGGSGDPRLHTLTRHKDVVHDLQQVVHHWHHVPVPLLHFYPSKIPCLAH